jgi:aminoglycoside phosphotransferase (APT) family kinase protein
MTSAGPVAVDADFAQRIARAAGGTVTVAALEVMAGGHSGLTHRARLHRPGGHTDVVIKSTPPGRSPRGRHDVLRQARVIEALARVPGVPVPDVLFGSSDDPPFFATDLVAGEAVDPVIAEDDRSWSPSTVGARWEAAIEILAALHALDAPRLGLVDGPPRTPAEELEIWCATMTAAKMDDDDAYLALRGAMLADVPPLGRAGLVHGDFRLGNILFDGVEPRALIDWEIWSLGDPLVDLAWFVQFTDGDNFPGVGQHVDGTPSAAEVIERYVALTGDARPETSWFIALGALKLAAIQAHNRRRHLDGRFHDPYQAQLGPSIERHLARGLDIMRDNPYNH